jgi:hypothetical protein
MVWYGIVSTEVEVRDALDDREVGLGMRAICMNNTCTILCWQRREVQVQMRRCDATIYYCDGKG